MYCAGWKNPRSFAPPHQGTHILFIHRDFSSQLCYFGAMSTEPFAPYPGGKAALLLFEALHIQHLRQQLFPSGL